MSVLIKGMKIPENCGKCRFAGVCGVHNTEEWPDLESIMFNDVIGVDGVRDPDCPLVPVPPHGRLIDADELAEDLDFDIENDLRALDDLDIVGKKRAHIQFDKDCKQNCMNYLSNCPTIIPAEGKEKA